MTMRIVQPCQQEGTKRFIDLLSRTKTSEVLKRDAAMNDAPLHAYHIYGLLLREMVGRESILYDLNHLVSGFQESEKLIMYAPTNKDTILLLVVIERCKSSTSLL